MRKDGAVRKGNGLLKLVSYHFAQSQLCCSLLHLLAQALTQFQRCFLFVIKGPSTFLVKLPRCFPVHLLCAQSTQIMTSSTALSLINAVGWTWQCLYDFTMFNWELYCHKVWNSFVPFFPFSFFVGATSLVLQQTLLPLISSFLYAA